MAYGKSRSVRFHNDMESGIFTDNNNDQNNHHHHHPASIKQRYSIDGAKVQLPQSLKMMKKESASSSSATSSSSLFLKTEVLSRVFPEDYERVKRKILDPRGETIHRWNKVLLVACLVSLFVDPLFFFLPSVRDKIYVKFRTAYVAPSSRIFGRGELVVDPWKIALRYFKGGFFIDLIAALPVPQVLIWGVIPSLSGSMMMNTKKVLRFILICQYLPRLFLIFPLSSQIVTATGVVTETAWAGAAYNLMLLAVAKPGNLERGVGIEKNKNMGRKRFELTITNTQS